MLRQVKWSHREAFVLEQPVVNVERFELPSPRNGIEDHTQDKDRKDGRDAAEDGTSQPANP